MAAMKARSGRTSISYFNIVDRKGTDMGWVGYCEQIRDAMLPAVLHPGDIAGAEARSKSDPPEVVGTYNGAVFVPYSWLRGAMTEQRDQLVVDMMKAAAEGAHRATQTDETNSPAQS